MEAYLIYAELLKSFGSCLHWTYFLKASFQAVVAIVRFYFFKLYNMSLLRLNHAPLAVLKPEHVLTIPATDLVELKQSVLVNTPTHYIFPSNISKGASVPFRGLR